MNKLKNSIIVYIFGVILSCSYFETRIGVKDCEFLIKDFHLHEVTLKEIKGRLLINIKNPNNTDILIERTEYQFGFDNKELLQGSIKKIIILPQVSSKVVSIDITMNNYQTVKMFIELILSEVRNVFIKGNVFLSMSGFEVFPLHFHEKKAVNTIDLKKQALMLLEKKAVKKYSEKLKNKLLNKFNNFLKDD